jgi:AcrR family transcriptional regulator
MTGRQRHSQLLDIGRTIFAERGFEATTIEEIAARAEVSKPVVYEHFGSKERLYAVVVDREVQDLLGRTRNALTEGNAHQLLERAALAFLDYIEDSSEGFRILVRDSPAATGSGGFASLISGIAHQVEHVLGREFTARGYEPALAPMYAQMLVGMVALTGQWWLRARRPEREQLAAHLVNLAWNGLSDLETNPAPLPKREPATCDT